MQRARIDFLSFKTKLNFAYSDVDVIYRVHINPRYAVFNGPVFDIHVFTFLLCLRVSLRQVYINFVYVSYSPCSKCRNINEH